VDVVTVAYRSAAHLRACVEPLAGVPGINVVVVDNACPERSAETVRDLPVTVVDMGRNVGFAAGCNAGAATGSSPAILFLNPDAQMAPGDVLELARVLLADDRRGAAGPRLLEANGDLQLSMRRTPRLRSAFAEALFIHHLLPAHPWTTEIVARGYEHAQDVEWLSGAVICIRRDAYEELNGFDERFFMYSEDTDIGTRLRRAGWTLRYDPSSTARHIGGQSAARAGQAAQRARARLTYARLHEPPLRVAAFRAALALTELLRLPSAALRSRLHFRSRVEALATVLRGSTFA
jgi:GT2 family glycosyltransferase